MVPRLREAADWRLVYWDRAASFWMPSDSQTTPRAVELTTAALPEVERVDDALILESFLAAAGAGAPRVTNLRRALELGGRPEPLLERLGALLLEMGRFEEAEAAFEELLQAAPRSASALNELAYLALRRGDPASAARYLKRALRERPHDERLRDNLRRVEEALRRADGKAGER